MRRPHIADRRSRTSLGTTAPVQPGPNRMQKTSQCEVIGRHPNNFAEHRDLFERSARRETATSFIFDRSAGPITSDSRWLRGDNLSREREISTCSSASTSRPRSLS